MSTRRKLEREMAKRGMRSAGGPVASSEMFSEGNDLAERIVRVLYERQPVNPMACLLALDVGRKHIELTVAEADISAEDREKFWNSYRAMAEQYEAAVAARRS